MLKILNDFGQEKLIIESKIKDYASKNGDVKILEAGCGRKWPLDLHGIKYVLTGLDMDKNALEIRKHQTKDLDEIIEGDLRTAQFDPNRFDIIYNSYVLEHVKGAERVMQNFINWLKPGGLLIIRFPDRNTAFGFVTRITPFILHVFYKKYVQGNPNAGKPGHDPYPVYYDPIVSLNGMRAFCQKNNLLIREEWGHPFPAEWDKFKWLISFLSGTVSALSFGRLAHKHNNITYILEKKISN